MTESTSPVPIDELLAHAAWVNRLARRLVRDAATADDVVQQTWVAGLRSPPTDRARVRGWLARVVRNFAHETHRSRASRDARELRVARLESVTLPPEALLERAEATRGLAAAVTRLSEPYRSTILRRYYQGLSAQEIAAQENASVETIRTRIKRGVELLRGDLRSRDGENWAAALAPLCVRGGAASAARVLRHARRARTTRVAAFGAAAALLGATAWTVFHDDAAAPPRDSADARGAGAAPQAPAPPSRDPVRRNRPRTSEAPQRDAAGRPLDAAATAPADTKAAAVATVAVAVELRAAAGAVAVPIKVVASPLRVGVVRSRDWARTFDLAATGGPIDLPRTSPIGTAIAAWDLRVEHPDLVPERVVVELPAADAAPSTAVTCALPLTPAGVVSGVVHASTPLAGLAPWAAAISGGLDAPTVVDQAPVGADGAYRLRLAAGFPHRIVVAALGARPAGYLVSVPAREVRRADVVSLDSGGTIVGVAEGFDGGPAADGRVGVLGLLDGRPSSFGPYSVTIGESEIDWTTLQTKPDEAGRFRVSGLRPSKYRVGVSTPGMTAERVNALTRDVTPGGGEERFVVTAGAVALRVLREGAPLAGAELLVAGPVGSLPLTADASGRTRFLGEPGAKYEVRLRGAAAKGAPPPPKLLVVAPALGSTHVEPFETKSADPPARMVLTLRGADPPAQAGVALYAEGAEFPNPPEVLRDAACEGGVIRLDGLPAGRFRLVVRPGGSWNDARTYILEQRAMVDLTAGGESTVELAVEAGGRLSLAARTPDGRYAAARCVLRNEMGDVVHFVAPRRETWGTGEFSDALPPSGPVVLSPALRPGAYVVTCSVAGGPETGSKNVIVRAGEVTSAIVDLEPR